MGSRTWLDSWLFDEAYRTMLLFGVAALLGLTSLVLFFFSSAGSPTRFQFGLLLAAMLVVFYLTLWGNTF
ncbi:hypothetical protein [Halorussus salinisoli]|uniref:hypothetical protein n=1 Tax=Halorussus salinisoli TaxID=2558242 RepID=UPI0010C1AC67|nr:hypothetical protein [Halorussus salinisoli]